MQNNEDIIIDHATDSTDSAVHTHTLPDGTTVSIRRGLITVTHMVIRTVIHSDGQSSIVCPVLQVI